MGRAVQVVKLKALGWHGREVDPARGNHLWADNL